MLIQRDDMLARALNATRERCPELDEYTRILLVNDALDEVLGPVLELVEKWKDDLKTYPAQGAMAAAAVRLCLQELEESLGLRRKSQSEVPSSSSGV